MILFSYRAYYFSYNRKIFLVVLLLKCMPEFLQISVFLPILNEFFLKIQNKNFLRLKLLKGEFKNGSPI